ncbi:Ribosomal large subunit pseudouridine synthase D [Seminavis robusta]|uniref:Ribosomal large subunit pseudouridine synthase D n=1 Tax=Seminavis robusta TaxID=568900 RepID=A0A9N8ECP8_9STRA|nr:Ribosomal large subunit pseudouridine synthase D [Seminavis robusta]|eukprot:Sro810_g205780.1 Ribosomal large subunit pseudouridine synthase D (483) ;mRNA; r:27333-28895
MLYTLSSTVPMLFLFGYIFCSPLAANGFLVTQQKTETHRHPSISVAWAKPSPKASFDLEAIEAFESQLEELEQQNAGKTKDTKGEQQKEPQCSIQTVVVPENLHNKRIDAVLAALLEPELSRSVCGNLVAEGLVQILSEDQDEGQVMNRKSFKVEKGMQLEVSLPQDEKPTEIVAQEIPLDILFEDEHMIVINKAAHIVVHPAAGNWDGTIVNALAHYLPRSEHGRGDFVDEQGKTTASALNDQESEDALAESESVDESNTVSFRPGIVHRLDKGTTGVLVVAKTSRALTALSAAFAARRVSKTYLAVTVGNPGNNVKIDKPIGRHPVHRQRMRVVPDRDQKNSRNRLAPPSKLYADSRPPSQVGRRALSFVDSLAFDGKLALVRVKIETGRTHQIRVHLQDRHTPIYGDDVYGLSDWNKRLSKTYQIDRPLLHAYKLSLEHPITGEPLDFTAPLHDDMMGIANTIVPPGSEPELSELLTWR